VTESITVPAPESVADLLNRRRSVRVLADGPLPDGAIAAFAEAIERSPASMGMAPWRIVLLEERRGEFWDLVDAAFRARLADERLERYLKRLDGFRPAALVALVYEDLASRQALRDTGVTDDLALEFNLQGLGIVQYSIWLTATGLGLGASLQHWNAQIETPLAAFTGLDPERYRLVSQIPIGWPADSPAPRDPEPGSGWIIDPRPSINT
jgi:uncharacterized protein